MANVDITLQVPFARRMEKDGKTSNTAGGKVAGLVFGQLDERLQRVEDRFQTSLSENLLTFPRDLNNAVWKRSAGISVTANEIAAPNGEITADTLTVAADDNWLGYDPPITFVAGTRYMFSVWLKRKTGSGDIDINADPYNESWLNVPVSDEWGLFSVEYTPPTNRTPAQCCGIILRNSGDAVYAWDAILRSFL